ncbi:hypothetical protein AK966_04335 [Vibrio sp. PID23_8]|nr:hypothetical protein AK965_09965 [Vibrio sp. PID17_43]RIZ55808.1 hypothetical protein AK966_04335 [Vibrio sp. PID23_8]
MHEGEVTHVIAGKLIDCTHNLAEYFLYSNKSKVMISLDFSHIIKRKYPILISQDRLISEK